MQTISYVTKLIIKYWIENIFEKYVDVEKQKKTDLLLDNASPHKELKTKYAKIFYFPANTNKKL